MNKDLEILRFMIRKKLNHDLTTMCSDNDGGIRTFFHSKRSKDMQSRIREFAKSPFKYLNGLELDGQLRTESGVVLLEIYSDISNMLLDREYKPCEDCTHFVKYLDDKDFSQIRKSYCSLHPEMPSDAGVFETKKILECRKTNWADYYDRTTKDLTEIRDVLKDAIGSVEKKYGH